MTTQDAADAFVAKVLANAPPLTEQQRCKLAELLRPVRVPNSGNGNEAA